MIWFKHDTDMHTDLKIQALMDKFGIEGYGIWNLCLELVGKEGKNGRLNGGAYWKEPLKRLCGYKDTEKLDNIVKFMGDLGLLSKVGLEEGTLEIPTFMARADDYSRRKNRGVRTMFGQCSDNVRKEEKRREEKRREYTQSVFDYFCLKTKKSLKYTTERVKIIESRLEEGYTPDQLKSAVDNFIRDDWADRHKFLDIVYCIGKRNKIDNLERWLNWKPTNRRMVA